MTFGRGHKTGLYLDQRDNRRRDGALAAGRDVLDAFSYTARVRAATRWSAGARARRLHRVVAGGRGDGAREPRP